MPPGGCLDAVSLLRSGRDPSHVLNGGEESSRRHDVDGSDELVPVVQVVEGVRHTRRDAEEVARLEVEDLFASLDRKQLFEDIEGVVLLLVLVQRWAGHGRQRHSQESKRPAVLCAAALNRCGLPKAN
jgi:hypothetical protein